ncbi:MAG: hypothetical protein ICV77_11725 [Cyanobacteria bacterium Co-bin8]|nr:hypothetical protein [Cyanobacteria bacterium Co-bin8]
MSKWSAKVGNAHLLLAVVRLNTLVVAIAKYFVVSGELVDAIAKYFIASMQHFVVID